MRYYIIVDLEMCRVPKRNKTRDYHWNHEIIQIGAVMLDENYDMIDEFNTFVKPRYGCLSAFITSLTGIRETDLQDAPDTAEAVAEFCAWLPENAQLVAWSDSDRAQFKHELFSKKLSDIGRKLLQNEWIDCQEMFDKKISASQPYSLTNALNISDINYRDGIHNGLVDAYNTALLFRKLQTEENFTFNSYFHTENSPETGSSCGTSLGDLLAGLTLKCAAV